MSAADAAARVADRFDEDGIDYAIGGALALGVWGAPRNTVDVDVTVFVDPAGVARVIDALERAGVMLGPDAARDATRIGLIRGRLGRAPIDVFIASHPHHVAMRTRRRAVIDPGGHARWFISPEDLMVLKLFFGRPKDVLDLERLVAIRDDLDLDYVAGWLAKMVPADDRRLALLAALRRRPA
ncbi:MAG: hypothetical protein IPL61_26545 [Myxococcales bacterium]|nr:hypothetical protein [Myxococcales bacterium]